MKREVGYLSLEVLLMTSHNWKRRGLILDRLRRGLGDALASLYPVGRLAECHPLLLSEVCAQFFFLVHNGLTLLLSVRVWSVQLLVAFAYRQSNHN